MNFARSLQSVEGLLMNPNVTSLLYLGLLILTGTLLLSRLTDLKRGYYLGIAIWSRWLPVCAVGVYIATLAVNLIPGSTPRLPMSLGSYFSTPELVVFFAIGPLFLTRLGNLLASASIVYALDRLLSNPHTTGTNVGLFLLLGSLTIIAILADKIPWLAVDGPSVGSHKFREVILVILTISAMGVLCSGLFHVSELTKWINLNISIYLSDFVVFIVLLALLVGWITVALGYTRHLTLPLLCLPTVFVLAFISDWPSYCLIVPFTICQALSLAMTDRRSDARRRGNGYSPKLSWI